MPNKSAVAESVVAELALDAAKFVRAMAGLVECITSSPVEGIVAEENNKKVFSFFLVPNPSKARAGWPTRLRLIWATPLADFAVITAQL